MNKLIFSLSLLCSVSVLNAKDIREVQDVISWNDFEGDGLADFHIGEAHYSLKYYIREKLDDDVPSFFFYNPNFIGGLLISTDKSDVTKLELKWNDTDCEYTSDMFMYVTGNDSPWESVEAVMEAKPEKAIVGRFRYYAYDSRLEMYGDDPETVVVPTTKYKHYAITPGFTGSNNVRNYVFEFIVTREFDVEGLTQFRKVTSLDFDSEDQPQYILSTGTGVLLNYDGEQIVLNHKDISKDEELFADLEEESIANFKILSHDGNYFQLFENESYQYVTLTSDGKLTLGNTPTDFLINDGNIVSAETGAVLGFDGTDFVALLPDSRVVTAVEPLHLFSEYEEETPTGVEGIAEETNDEHIEYYTIEGFQLCSYPQTPGLYISRQGNKTGKFIVK